MVIREGCDASSAVENFLCDHVSDGDVLSDDDRRRNGLGASNPIALTLSFQDLMAGFSVSFAEGCLVVRHSTAAWSWSAIAFGQSKLTEEEHSASC